MKFLLFILSTLIVASHSRPQDTRMYFPDEIKEISANLVIDEDILPGANDTEEFIIHPNANERLENGEFFQGDMRLMPDQVIFYTQNDTSDDEEEVGRRTGVLNAKYRWKKDRSRNVIVPYMFDSDAFTKHERSMIILAMNYLEQYTCVRFMRRVNQPDYINFIADKGCYSWVGKIGGKQNVSLEKGGCFTRGTIIHEIIHALGYDHQQNHADRDKFIDIAWENLRSDGRYNFERVDPKKFGNFNTGYDYLSVMHYPPTAFSKNGKATIIPKDSRFRDRIGQRRGLSNGDVQRINNMYNCKVKK